MAEIINQSADEIIQKLGTNLESLILVGSFARNEGIEGLSDIEFWAIVKNLSKTKPKLDSNVSLGFTTRNNLVKLKPYIYTIEVKKFGKVIYGDTEILKLIPNYTFEEIDPLDGFILLNNRLIEQLILFNLIEGKKPINQYEFDKGYVQLVNSYLVLNKRYRSLYVEKREQFRNIPNIDSALSKMVEDAFASIAQQSRATVEGHRSTEMWFELREHFRKAWEIESRLFLRLVSKPVKLWIYCWASKLYFTDAFNNRTSRNKIISNWEKFIK